MRINISLLPPKALHIYPKLIPVPRLTTKPEDRDHTERPEEVCSIIISYMLHFFCKTHQKA
jgi:hypothetical protein